MLPYFHGEIKVFIIENSEIVLPSSNVSNGVASHKCIMGYGACGDNKFPFPFRLGSIFRPIISSLKSNFSFI